MMACTLAIFITVLLVPCAALASSPATGQSEYQVVGEDNLYREMSSLESFIAYWDSTTRTVQSSDGWEVRWNVFNGLATRDRGAEEKLAIVFYRQHPPTEGCDYTYDFGRVLSVVGTLVSIETRSGLDCVAGGAAKPFSFSRFETIDLRTGEEVDIRLLVPDSALVAALKQNTVVKEALSRKAPWEEDSGGETAPGGKEPSDLYSLIKAVYGGCEMSFHDLATSFAFHHRSGDQVVVRFGLTHGCNAMMGTLTVIEVSLPIPVILASDLADAEAKGHLMKDLADVPFQWPSVIDSLPTQQLEPHPAVEPRLPSIDLIPRYD